MSIPLFILHGGWFIPAFQSMRVLAEMQIVISPLTGFLVGLSVIVSSQHGGSGRVNQKQKDCSFTSLVIPVLIIACLRQGLWYPMHIFGFSRDYGSVSRVLSLAMGVVAAVSIAFAVRTAKRGYLDGKARPRVLWILTAVGLGGLIWNLVTRGVRLGYAESLLVAFIAVGAICVSAIWLLVTSKERESDQPQDGDEVRHKEFFELLASYELTVRESEAVAAMLAGLSSSETAEELGIKASTVRSRLQRAYRRIGVRDADALRRKVLDDGNQRDSDETYDTSSDDDLDPCSVRHHMLLVALLVVLGATLLPVPGAGGIWGIGQDVIFATSAGMLLGSLGGFLLRKGNSCFTEKQSRVQGFLYLGLIVWLLCGVVVLLSIDGSAWWRPVWLKPFSLLPFIARVALIALDACMLIHVASSQAVCAHTAKKSCIYPLIFLVVGLIGVGLPISMVRPVLLGAGVVYIFIFQCRVGCIPASSSTKTEVKLSGYVLVGVVLLGLSLGGMVEEAWRELSGLSYWATSLPFALTLIASTCMVCLLIVRRIAMRLLLVLGAWVLLMHLLLIPPAIILCFICCISVIFILSMLIREADRQEAIIVLSYALIAFAIGSCGLAWVVNAVYDRLFFSHAMALKAYSGDVLLAQSVLLYLLAVMFLLGSIATVGLMRSIRTTERIHQLERVVVGNLDQRLHAFFISQGLSDLEAQVSTRIFHGYTSPEISEAINYSRGSINTARASSYKKLRVHSRLELIEAIRQGLGL
ncbi:LuxR C-terminal-related transcriptional regulator [Collinsella sp. AGMB00827]|uniref:LuxR C-terminal-related transcriptional regulator n=1 Tax=Collinsella ureilytica TaxID=2869515 RepID=A0ABS7MLG2_9ACTN|nr:LuxR C-terminal-related transcriptional regulator [Collinsella urealyticum]